MELSAVPLKKTGFDAMGLPGIKPFVQASIADVINGFVRPNAYTLDVERMLLGRDASLQTRSIGRSPDRYSQCIWPSTNGHNGLV